MFRANGLASVHTTEKELKYVRSCLQSALQMNNGTIRNDSALWPNIEIAIDTETHSRRQMCAYIKRKRTLAGKKDGKDVTA